jgi:hypothetical protein
MSPSLQRLLLDHIRRGGWYWLLVGFMQVTAALNYAVSPRTTAIAFPMMGALFAPMVLGVAEQRGWFQALMMLPLSRREIARARWWAAIGMPGLFLTTLSLAAFIVFPALGWRLREPSWQTALWLLSGWAILGLFAQARSWLRVRPGGSLTARKCLVAAAYLALAVPALFFVGSEGYGRPLVIAATAAGLAVDVYLYWRAEHLLFWQVGRAGPATSIGKEPITMAGASYGAGWSAFMGQWARRLVVFAAFVALAIGLLALINRLEGGGLFVSLCVSFLSLFVVLSCFLASPWLTAARAFRALPLSADRLAATFLLLAMAPAWAVLLMIFVISVPFPGAAASVFAPFGLLSAALASFLVPILLRFGQQKAMAWAILPIIAPAPILDPMMAIFHPDAFAAWIQAWMSATVLIAAIAGYLSFLWTRRELHAGRGAYRQAALPGQNAAA